MAKAKSAVATQWRSPDGLTNAHALQANYPAAFGVIAEIDALGHRVLKRAGDAGPAEGADRIVGLALLAQAVAGFVGLRHLFESSAIQPALVVGRAQFEVFLALRYLVYGGRRRLALETPSSSRLRETRARYFMVGEARRDIYRRQAMLDGADGSTRARASVRPELAREIAAELSRLNRHFATQQRAFGPVRCLPGAKRRYYFDLRPWYSFGFRSGKVNSVKALAERLGLEGHYFLLYSPVSSLIHATSISHSLTIAGRQAQIHSPYNPEAFAFLAYWTCSWQMLTLAYAAKAYCPNSHEDLQRTHAKVAAGLLSIEAEAVDTVLG